MGDGEFVARCGTEIQQCLKDGAKYWRARRVDAFRLAKLAGQMHWFVSYPTVLVAVGRAEELTRLAAERLLNKVTDRMQSS